MIIGISAEGGLAETYGFKGTDSLNLSKTQKSDSIGFKGKTVIILTVCLLLLFNLVFLAACNVEKKYADFFANDAKYEFELKQLSDGFIPQGLCAASGGFIVSGYMDNGGSRLQFYKNGEYKSYQIKVNGKAFDGHVGGVAASGDYFWVTSETTAYYFKTADLEADEKSISPISSFDLCLKGSTCTVWGGYLWVAEFYEEKSYKIDGHGFATKDGMHYAIAAAFKISDEKSCGVEEIPEKVLSIREKTQGIAFENGKIVLSTSYGRKNDSALYFYDSPLDGESDSAMMIDGVEVPVWYLVGGEKLVAPPMTEGITCSNGRLFVLFESAAKKYTTELKKCKYPISSVVSIAK